MQDFIDILLPLPFDRTFTYKVKAGGKIGSIAVGDIVLVPFRNKKLWGLVTGYSDLQAGLKADKIKEIIAKHDEIRFSSKLIDFIERIASYNLAYKGLVLKAFIGILNSDKVKNPQKNALKQQVDLDKIFLKKLSDKQQEIFDEIAAQIVVEDYDKNDRAKVSLIDAVTGSGKTEIYFSLIAKILQNNDSQALILLPEIALTSQLLTRFEEQFGFKPALWHSKISTKEKREIFYGVFNGSVRVLIGARSSLLLPFRKLKLIVIDEEHDASFKQEDIFNFNARDMAILKASLENFTIILSSATPSIETYQNAKSKKYNYYYLSEKFNQKNNKINIVDLRINKLEKDSYISQIMREALAKNLELKQQSLLFLNRRGYAPVTLCKECGQKINCPDCNAYLVHHKHAKNLVCHYCGHHENFSRNCKYCQKEGSITNIGAGVEKIEEEIKNLFSQARIACITSDNITNFKESDRLIKQIYKGEIDIIVGTQLIAKGYDFPNLTLVGIVDADSGFYSSELRASERSFQLLSQVIGRAGRKDYQGTIYIQTYNPQNFIFEKIIQNDKTGFLEYEIKNRQALNLPPFTKMANIIVSNFDQTIALNVAKKIVSKFPINDAIEVMGPAPAPLLRIKNRFYYRIFIKVEKKINLQKLILDIINNIEITNNVRIKIDIDPQ